MDIDVNDARTRLTEEATLVQRYPLGAFLYLSDQEIRVTVVGHTSDELITLNGDVKMNVVPSDDVIVLGRSTEEYVQRLMTETRKVAHDNGSVNVANTALERLTTEPYVDNHGVLRVRVTTVGHYVLSPRYGLDYYQAPNSLTDALRAAYYARHGEFDSSYFRNANEFDNLLPGDTMGQAVASVTMEIVNSFTNDD